MCKISSGVMQQKLIPSLPLLHFDSYNFKQQQIMRKITKYQALVGKLFNLIFYSRVTFDDLRFLLCLMCCEQELFQCFVSIVCLNGGEEVSEEEQEVWVGSVIIVENKTEEHIQTKLTSLINMNN